MDGHCQFNKRTNHTYNIFCYVFCTSNNIWFFDFINGYMGLYDIYSKQVRRTIMAQETIKDMLKMIDAKIEHIEDISADNRAIIVKLVKQSNQIVQFLKQLELDVDMEYGIEAPSSFGDTIDKEKLSEKRMLEVKEILEEFKSKKEDLKEFEEELKKHKDKLTPGQVGES